MPAGHAQYVSGLHIVNDQDLNELVPLLYRELREIAHRARAARGRTPDDTTLSTTALVHEAYLKLVEQAHASWESRAHFLAIAGIAVRHILVDRARARLARKRGGGAIRVPLRDDVAPADRDSIAMLDLDEALTRLAELDVRLVRVVECRFFGGLSEEETASALNVTARTVQRDWAKARILLRRELSD